MWKPREDSPAAPGTQSSAAPAAPQQAAPAARQPEFRAEVAHIGKSVVVKGELSGSEDLYLDGEVEGSIELREHSLTIGPNGKVRANVHARDVIIHGKVEGNIEASDRLELKKSAILMGDVATSRIVIEDGAFFKGSIDIRKEAKPEVRRAAAATAQSAAPAAPAGSGLGSPAAGAAQPPLR